MRYLELQPYKQQAKAGLSETARKESSQHEMMAVWERMVGMPEAFEPVAGMADSEVEEFIDESLREFPEQVAGEQAESFSAEDHYDLGIAYKTMGLLDKAVSEFLFALNGTGRFTDALLMLALCCKERKVYSDAANYLEEALGNPLCRNEQSRMWLTYELANLYELQGRLHDAFTLYEEIVRGGGEYLKWRVPDNSLFL